LSLGGLNITMPFKHVVAAHCDRLTETASALGSCNTLYWDGSEIVGHSTDGDGYINSFQSQSSVDLGRTSVCVVGTGGAARSIIEALGRRRVPKIVVAGRDISRAEAAASLAPVADATLISDDDAVADCGVIINATSVGMEGGPDPLGIPLAERIINQNHTVSDIVYHPHITPLLRAAETRGALIVGGLGMLAHQAALSFGLWTGEIAPIDVMTAHIERPY
jgi:shikimate dehydrogenase